MPDEKILPERNQRAAIYTRCSSDMRHSASLEDQERNCRQVAEKNGWEVLDEFVHGDSATAEMFLRRRDGLDLLVSQAQETPRPFDILIADEMSCLGRTLQGTLDIANILRRCNVKLYIVSYELDSAHPGLNLILSLIGRIAEMTRETMRNRVLWGLEGRVRNGFASGGRCFGYKSVAFINATHSELEGRASIEGYKSVVYEPEAVTVRRIFHLFADGCSASEIAHLLNSECVPTPRVGTGWRDSGVRRILKNEKYIGKRIWRKTSQTINPFTGKTVKFRTRPQLWVHTEVPDLRLIPDDLWMQVQERLTVANEKMKRRQIAALNLKPAKSAAEAA